MSIATSRSFNYHDWIDAAREHAMKNLWFHLMPYKDLPDDFRDRHASVWVDIDSRLLDAARVHEHYHEYLDELEYAGEVGFDGICCNEHHQNGYGLMPSPNLIAAALTRRTHLPAICVMGNSLALYNPPTRVAEEFAMLDCLSGGRLIAGFPGRHTDGHRVRLSQNPSKLRDRYLEAHDIVMKAWTRPGNFFVQRPLQPVALCERLAASDTKAASAGVDSGRRFGRNVALVR